VSGRAAEKKEDPIADAAERARALDVTGSFVVQAPAGSGKTGLLVLRFLALLVRVERPEAVLAITFTRKAAAEMRRRIVDALLEAKTQSEPPPEAFERERFELAAAVLAHDAALGWRLLDSPSRLQVFTIDGFCSRVVAGTPLLSRLGSTPGVVDDASMLYREAVRRTLSPSGRALLGEHLEILLERYEMGMDRLEGQLVEMLGRRDQWREGVVLSHEDESAWVDEVEAAFGHAIGAEVASIATDAEASVVARVHDTARRSRAEMGSATAWPTLGEADKLGGDASATFAWKQAAALLTKEGGRKLRRRSTRDADVYGGDAALKSDFQDLVEDIASLPAARVARWLEGLHAAARLPASAKFSEDGRRALGAFLAVLRHAYAALWEVFRERREVDHVEIGMSAVAALAPGETLERLDARLEHILVDEFQDTNVQQCDLLRGLTSGWQPGDGRTLFLVGDPMQSIYRFRKAEVGLFLAARSSPAFLATCRLSPVTLSVNFRSTRSVVGWVNEAFRVLLGDRDDATRSLVAFAPATPKPAADDGPAVDFVLWSSASATTAGEADVAEACGLADWIAEAVSQRRKGEAEKDGHAAPIAILVRARSHALPLLRALEARAPDLRLRAPGLDRLADRVVATDLAALTRALLHPGDRLSWLALLRSPWAGLTLGDLARLVEADVEAAGSARRATPVPLLLRDPVALERVSPDARQRIARVLAIADAAQGELSSRSLGTVVRSAWLRLGGLVSTNPRLEALEAEAFFDLLASRVREGSLDLDDFARALADTEAPVDLDASVDVEIMTMHKAKGLEFDTVILPALGRGTGGSTTLPLAMETEPDSGRLTLVAPRGARGRDDGDSDKHDFLLYREKRRGDAENLRLLYVAVTRARRRLLLSAAEGRLKKDGTPSAGSLLKALAPAVDVAGARVVTVETAAPTLRRAMMRLPADFVLASAPPSVADRSVTSESPSVLAEAAPVFFAEGKKAAHVGTVFHAFVERIAADGLEAWPRLRIAAEGPAIAHALRCAGVLAEELDDAAARVAAALEATLDDEKGRWILAAHEDARSEWGVQALRERKLTSAVFDRTFVADGTHWIVDFKTGTWEAGGDAAAVEARLADKARQYAPQLARYRELLRGHGAGGPPAAAAALSAAPRVRPVRLALFFPEWPSGRRWLEITSTVDAMETEAAGNANSL